MVDRKASLWALAGSKSMASAPSGRPLGERIAASKEQREAARAESWLQAQKDINRTASAPVPCVTAAQDPEGKRVSPTEVQGEVGGPPKPQAQSAKAREMQLEALNAELRAAEAMVLELRQRIADVEAAGT